MNKSSVVALSNCMVVWWHTARAGSKVACAGPQLRSGLCIRAAALIFCHVLLAHAAHVDDLLFVVHACGDLVRSSLEPGGNELLQCRENGAVVVNDEAVVEAIGWSSSY